MIPGYRITDVGSRNLQVAPFPQSKLRLAIALYDGNLESIHQVPRKE
jgi:hypothetical protein